MRGMCTEKNQSSTLIRGGENRISIFYNSAFCSLVAITNYRTDDRIWDEYAHKKSDPYLN